MVKRCPRCDALHNRNHAWCAPCHAAYMRQWRKGRILTAEQRRKGSARSYANVYLRRGKITREPCIDCGIDEAEMHHEDYDKPTEVIWLCRDCHLDRHREEAAAKARQNRNRGGGAAPASARARSAALIRSTPPCPAHRTGTASV